MIVVKMVVFNLWRGRSKEQFWGGAAAPQSQARVATGLFFAHHFSDARFILFCSLTMRGANRVNSR